MTLPATPAKGLTREQIIDLIREKYDPAPNDWSAREAKNWDDGAGEIADAVLASFAKSSQADFHNRIRILGSIDFHELVAAGVLIDDADGEAEWKAFRANPFRYFIACDDETCDRIWQAIEARS